MLDNFIKELIQVSEENKSMKNKINLIQDKINFIIENAEKKEEFSEIQLIMFGIAKQLQDIIDK